MKDEIESIPPEPDTCEMQTPEGHRMMFKALENPLRRKIIKSLGIFGKTTNELMDEVHISESQLKFQLDFLIKECYAQKEGNKYVLNSKGLDELLANIK